MAAADKIKFSDYVQNQRATFAGAMRRTQSLITYDHIRIANGSLEDTFEEFSQSKPKIRYKITYASRRQYWSEKDAFERYLYFVHPATKNLRSSSKMEIVSGRTDTSAS